MEWWEEKGKEAYRVLGECVEQAILDENAEMAVICGYPLLKMAEVEKGSFFGLPEKLLDLQRRKAS